MQPPRHRILGALALAAAFAVPLAPARAETMTFRTDLNASSEVPPNNSAGRGTLTAGFDTATRRLTWQGTLTGLTGDPTAAHFHGPAEAGKNAGVMIPSPGVKGDVFEGAATLTEDQGKALVEGRTYFNVHTGQNPGGEVRGQVVRVQ